MGDPDVSDLDDRPLCERLQEELDLQRLEAARAVERAHDLENRLTYVLEAHELYARDGVYTFPDGETWRQAPGS